MYYTYAYLREDGTPYYIGKGKGRRIHDVGHRVPVPPKNRRIYLKQNLSEEDALRHEVYMIHVLGRKINGSGILRNYSEGGEGLSGHTLTEETKKKISIANTGKTSYWKGKKQPKEAVAKMVKTKLANGDCIGEKNPRAKQWRIEFESGEVVVVKSLQTWAIANGYVPMSLRNLYNGRGIKRHKDIVSVMVDN
jgi:hypothetical protein